MAARSRYWCFTENVDPDQLRHALIDEGLPDGIDYICGQIEQGEHLHYQGYLELPARQRVSWLKSNLSATAHFEIRRGTQEEAIEYTKKVDPTTVDMTWNEWGDRTEDRQGKRNDLKEAKALIDEGASEKEVATQCFASWCRYRASFAAYRALLNQAAYPRSVREFRGSEVSVVVYYGEPGCGKSETARAVYPGAYDKPAGDDWFDLFDSHETILFDEFTGGWLPRGVLLKLMDKYPVTVKTKGGHSTIGSTYVVFTTNTHPRLWYKHSNYAALERRITKFYWCTKAMNDEDTDPEDRVFQELPPPFDCPAPFWENVVDIVSNNLPGYRWN